MCNISTHLKLVTSYKSVSYNITNDSPRSYGGSLVLVRNVPQLVYNIVFKKNTLTRICKTAPTPLTVRKPFH